MISWIKATSICFLCLLLLLDSSVLAQKLGGELDDDKNFKFLPIPYLNYSRSLEFSYGLLPLAMYKISKKDTVSPSSMTGGLIMKTTNGTWMGLAFGQFYFNKDNWRSTIAGGTGNVNFQMYPNIGFLPPVIDYSTEADFFMMDLQRKIVEDMYFGVGYIYANMNTAFDLGPLPIPEQSVQLNGLRFIYSYDLRDNVYYPHKGFITNPTLNVFPGFMGNAEASQNLELDFNKYFEMPNEADVVAARAFVGLGLGEISFNQQFIVGQTDLRGYSQGEYRGDQLYALQGEYRWNFSKLVGLVGFAGLATISGSSTEAHNGLLLPAVGGGFRINVFPENHFNVGMDFGVGRNDWSLDFRIGETF